jgi:hypothetical protein
MQPGYPVIRRLFSAPDFWIDAHERAGEYLMRDAT